MASKNKLAFDELLHFISKSTKNKSTILTANQRQTRMLKEQVAHASLTHAAQNLRIMSLTNWVNELWLDAIDHGSLSNNTGEKLLSEFEDTLIWEKLLEHQEDLPPLVNKQDLSRQLKDAYTICESYCVPIQELISEAFDETNVFLNIREQYHQYLNSSKLINKYQFIQTLVSSADDLHVQSIYVYGFSDISPLIHALLEKLCAGPVTTVELPPCNTSSNFYAAATEEDEIRYAAQWAADLLERTPKHERIAIVHPNLSNVKNTFSRTLLKQLELSNYFEPGSNKISHLFDVSAGDPLNMLCIARTAMMLNKLLDPHARKKDINYLLRSPYWGNGFSHIRQHLVREIRRMPEHKVNIFSLLDGYAHNKQPTQGDFFTEATLQPEQVSEQEHTESDIERLIKHHQSDFDHELSQLHSIRAFKHALGGLRPYSEWISLFTDFLKLCGFPGPATLSSFEYQVAHSFITALDELAQLDALETKPINFERFHTSLETKLSSTVFQSEVKKPRIHVLGLMEATGLVFDHCLVLGLSSNTLPAAPSPHPFIPISVQRKYDTPKSSPIRELDYAKRFLETLIENAKHIVLSYHKESAGDLRSPSPLLQEKWATDQALENAQATAQPKPQPAPLEIQLASALNYSNFTHIDIGNGPTIDVGETIKGGTYHLTTHWINPIFAFFQFRLGLKDDRKEVIGFSSIERGNLIHSYFEALYTKYSNSDDISELLLSENTEYELVDIARHVMASNRSNKLPTDVIEYEFRNMANLGRKMLELDAQRQQAFNVSALETDVCLEIYGRKLPIRIDRIDQLDDSNDTYVVFDYKTNTTTLSGIVKQEIQDFQLPLYSLATSPRPSALAFIEVKNGETKFNGLNDTSVNIPGMKAPNKVMYSQLTDNWNETLDGWAQNIELRTQEIVTGNAIYHPRTRSKQAYFEHFEAAIRPEERKH